MKQEERLKANLKALKSLLDFGEELKKAQDKHELEHIKQMVFMTAIAKERQKEAHKLHELHIN